MLNATICRIGQVPIKVFLEEGDKISSLLNGAGFDLDTGEVVKSASTENRVDVNSQVLDGEEYIIVKEMKNA